MHTIGEAKRALGLATTNQVRNRIEAIRDLLSADLRRGPNNQILLTDEGLDLLRRLQGLCDTGLRLAEASEILRGSAYRMESPAREPCQGNAQNRVRPGSASDNPQRAEAAALFAALTAQVQLLRDRIASLERELATGREPDWTRGWWEHLKEGTDGP